MELLKSSLAAPKFQAICWASIPVTERSGPTLPQQQQLICPTLREGGETTEQQGFFIFQLLNPNPWVAEEDSGPTLLNSADASLRGQAASLITSLGRERWHQSKCVHEVFLDLRKDRGIFFPECREQRIISRSPFVSTAISCRRNWQGVSVF